MQSEDRSTTPVIDEMERIPIVGNIVPPAWFKTILLPSGKPDLSAIFILSEIAGWFLLETIVNQDTGEAQYFFDFTADKVACTAWEFGQHLGMTRGGARDVLVRLKNLGLLTSELRDVVYPDGYRATNIPHWGIVANVFYELTPPPEDDRVEIFHYEIDEYGNEWRYA